MISVRAMITLERRNAVNVYIKMFGSMHSSTAPVCTNTGSSVLIVGSWLVGKVAKNPRKAKGRLKQCSTDESEVPPTLMSISRLSQERKTGCLCTRQIVEISNKDGHNLTGSTERGEGIHDKIRRSFVDLIHRGVL